MRVVVAHKLPAAGMDLLRAGHDVVATEGGFDRVGLLAAVAGADALIADPTVPVDAELLDAAGAQLKVVSNFAVGVDNLDLDAIRERGVRATNTPDVLT